MGGTKLERFLTKNQHTQRKLLNFENWISGGLRRFRKSCNNIAEKMIEFVYKKNNSENAL